MPTKYDVFAEIIDRAPCKASELPFTTPVYAHLRALIQEKLIRQEHTQYTPIVNAKTKVLFRIIKYCLKNGLDYNVFFSKNMPYVLQEISQNVPILRPKTLRANPQHTENIQFLEHQQFILITQLRPRTGVLLKHQLLDDVQLLNANKPIAQIPYINIQEKLLTVRADPINPFDTTTFTFLAGSAQLEGSTVTPGETREMILNDIYPEKPKKDVQMVKNLNEALHYILEHLNEPITPEHIKELNKLVLFSMHRNAGNYKKTHNKIQGNPSFKTTPPQQVPQEMDAYCAFLGSIENKKQCVEQLGYIHNQLQRIHPFSDGNSRTTRMVLSWVLIKHSLPLLVMKMGCFDAYMNLTKLSEKRDDKTLTQLLQHILYHEHLLP